MRLTEEQIGIFDREGFLILHEYFSEIEISFFQKKLDNLFKQAKNVSEPEVVKESNGDIRSIFSPYKFDAAFQLLSDSKRIVEPIRQLLNDKIYLYQYKINTKSSFSGEYWDWHQDFSYWHLDDKVKMPHLISAMVLFQNTESIQGPLLMLSGSHKHGIVNFERKDHLLNGKENLSNSLGKDLKYTISREIMREFFNDRKIVEGKGRMGTCIFFHSNLFHASGCNLSPFNRHTAIMTYNSLKNRPGNNTNRRPEFLCSRDFKALEGIEFSLTKQ